jgi:hypothetical protein
MNLTCWITENIVGILGIIIGSFIAYHVFYLSQEKNLADKMKHKELINEKIYKLLRDIRNRALNSKVEIINTKRYHSDYPHRNDRSRKGYTYLGAELKDIRYDGIEFFCSVTELYISKDNVFSLDRKPGYSKSEFNVFVAGIIPYEWIEYIDTHGDEFSYRPQLFVNFKGKDKEPYKYYNYYIKSDDYQENKSTFASSWKKIEIEK